MTTRVSVSDATPILFFSQDDLPIGMFAATTADPHTTVRNGLASGLSTPDPLLPNAFAPALPVRHFPLERVTAPVAAGGAQGLIDSLTKNLPTWLKRIMGLTTGDTQPNPETLPQVQRSELRSAYAADILASDTNLWTDNATLDMAMLQDIVDNPADHSPDTVRAALILLTHPEELGKITGIPIGSLPGSTLSQQALSNYSKSVTLKTPPAVNNADHLSRSWRDSLEAADILGADAELWKDKSYLDMGDLADIASHPQQHPLETVLAAQVMLENLPQFSLADGINTDGVRDGEIWRRDLINFASSIPADADNAGPFIDTSSPDFMQRALASVTARAQLQQALGMRMPGAVVDPLAELARQSLLGDAQLWQGKTFLTQQDLSTVLSNPYAYQPATVSAALYMLQHPQAFNNGDATSFDPAAALQARLDIMLARLDTESDAVNGDEPEYR